MKQDYIDKYNARIRIDRQKILNDFLFRMYSEKCPKCGENNLPWEEITDVGVRIIEEKIYYHSVCTRCGNKIGYCFPTPESITGGFLTRGGTKTSLHFDPLIGVCY